MPSARWMCFRTFWSDEDITEIMVNGPSSIFVEKDGRLQKTDRKFESVERLDHIAQQIASGVKPDRK